MFIEAKDDGGGGDNWSYKLCKAPVRSSPPTNQHPVFSQAVMPFLSPNQQCQSTEGKLTVYDKLDKLVPWILLKLRMTEVGGGGDNWSCKICKSSS